MEKIETGFEGLYKIRNFLSKDERGTFIKSYNSYDFISKDIDFKIKEVYYSISKKNVIRGMHFQLPPNAVDKLIMLHSGIIRDVVLDIRTKSYTYGKYYEMLIDSPEFSLFIPAGFAHGFEVMSEEATVFYYCSDVYSAKNDAGILWNSFGIDWNVKIPIMSERDKSFLSFHDFKSPF